MLRESEDGADENSCGALVTCSDCFEGEKEKGRCSSSGRWLYVQVYLYNSIYRDIRK